MTGDEQVDVVVVGARVAGSSAAVELARAGRRVVAVDSAAFPSDTLSTHIVWPETVAELRDLGALPELLALDTPRLRGVHVEHGGHTAEGWFSAVNGVDHALCPRRTVLDLSLVNAARRSGAEIRERTSLIETLSDGDRISGVVVRGRDGSTSRIRAKLVIGADGRRSTLARLVGAGNPYRTDANGRGLVFAYVEDPAPARQRRMFYQWRVERTLGNYFPTDEGTAIVLFMGPAEDVARFGPDLVHWNRMLDANPRLRERMGSGQLLTRLRKTADTASYFRRSAGPGWALAGDAGHFKDPVVAQGIRDAVHHGRRLGRAAAADLDDPQRLDHAVRRWERQRDRDCLPSYYWGLRHTRTHPVSAVEAEAFRAFETEPGMGDELADVFGRVRRPRQLTSLPRLVRWSARALRRPNTDRQALMAEIRAELALSVAEGRDLARLTVGRRVHPRARQAEERTP